MKKLLLLLVVVFFAFLLYNRYRVFVRDPLGSVARNGTAEGGAQVFINYDNDVLIENDNVPRYVEVLQHGGHGGVPVSLSCVHWLVCLADAYPATLVPGFSPSVDAMTNKEVRFRDAKGTGVVRLR